MVGLSRRLAVRLTAPILTMSVLGSPAAAASPEEMRLSAPPAQTVDSIAVKGSGRPADLSQGVATANPVRRLVRWPSPGTAEVDLGGTESHRAGTGPIWVAAAEGASATRSGNVARVKVSVLDRKRVPGGWRNGVVFRVDPVNASAGRISVSVDYSAFGTAFGADWAGRLRLIALPACALTTPDADGCHGKPLASSNDSKSQRVSAVLDLSSKQDTRPSGPGLAAAPTAGMLVALSAGPSGSTGDYGATTLQASSSWSAGNNTGDFAWSYPMSVPPALGGAAPSLGLAYSSSAVDGRSLATNNQPSWVGQGFEYWPGYIERRYTGCADDMGGNANNTEETGDLCWGTDNAVMSLNGSSAEFVRDDVTGVWKSKSDDGAKIERLDDSSNSSDNTVNGAWRNEYWKVTAADGTQYFFGRNRLSGYTGAAPANAVTNSTWLVPVAGNNVGERCRQSTYLASFCNQAWRWNLDYIVDRHGNTMSYWYTKHTNKYAKNFTDSEDTAYDRGGVLNRIDYGTNNRGGTDTVYTGASAPMRVEFQTADRCLTTSCGTHDAINWPDTPFDQQCSGTECPGVYTPTFWSTVRLSKITTKVWDAAKAPTAGYKDVNSWTLNHQFPPTGSGTPQGLWLESIVRTGHLGGTPISLPEINFDWVALENRVDTFNGTKPTLNWHRMSTIWTETGGKISIRYSGKQCVPGSQMPSSPHTNNLRCYPVLVEENDVLKTEWFHKYLVTEITEADTTGGSTDVVTKYEYAGDPAWRFTDDDGITKDKFRTWSEYRGYSEVLVRGGAPGKETLTKTKYLRGMHASKDTPSGTLKTVTVPASLGNETVNDENAYAGMVRESIVYNGVDTEPISKIVNVPRQSGPTATRDMGDTTVYARFVSSGTTYEATMLDAGRGWRTTKTTIAFDSYGMADHTTDWGLVSPDGVTDVPGDEACVDPTYVRNGGANILGLTSRVQTYAVACGQAVNTEDDVAGDVRTSYDGQAWGVAPTAGLPTKVETLKSWTKAGGTVWMDSSRTRYDAYGRPLESWDKRGNNTLFTYTPGSGPVTKVTTQTVLGWTSWVELEIGNGQPLAEMDPNNKRTDLAYDALGRLIKVWLPNRPKSTYQASPSMEHTYLIRNSGGVNAVATKTLNAATGATPVYTTTYTLYDGLLRQRQIQTAAVRGTGTIFRETIYDAAGRPAIANNHFHDPDKTAGTDLATVLDWQNKSQTVTEYDRAGRQVASIVKSSGVEKWRSTTAYGGDRVYVNPPNGATPTTTINDARGKTVELRQHSGGNTSGPFDSTFYKYNRKGQPEELIDASGNKWVSEFDILGRLERNDDPDKGLSTYTYNDFGDVLTSTDARNEVLAFDYDSIGRKVGMYDDTVAPANKLATWSWDPANAKGRLASSSRWTGTDRTNEYKTRIRGYTPLYQSTGEDYIIPASETGLGGTYTFTRSYKVDGSPATVGYPNAGGLGGETVSYSYDSVSGKLEQTRTNWPGAGQYVTDTDYTAFGEINFLEFAQTGGNWLQRSFTYDEITRRPLQFTTIRQIAPQIVADVHYKYDEAGNVVKIADTPAGGVADTQCFVYDHLQRLEHAWTPGSGDCDAPRSTAALGGPAAYWHSWTIDKVGNRLTQTIHAASGDTESTFTHPAAKADLPHAVSSVTTTGPGAGTKNYSYDAAGNQTCRPTPSAANNTCPSGANSQALTWNSEGTLARVADGSSTSDYVYTADGTRLVARDNSGTTLYLPGNELRRNASTGAVSATRFYTHGGNTCAMRTTSGLTWLVGDHQNTQSIAVAAGDQTVKQRRQTPYGTARGTTPVWPNARGFIGGDSDPTGLTHLGAREYDPSLGGFISVDPMIDPYDPQQMNAYTYSNNSPITFSDPDGRRFIPGLDGDSGGGGSSGGGGGGGGSSSDSGCSAVKLDCTVEDINQMTIKERKALVKAWLDLYGKKYYAQDWFECIMGVLDFMDDSRIAKPDSWSSLVDSAILQGIQDGLAIAEGKTCVTDNPGGLKWAAFFERSRADKGADSNHLRFLWSTAEQTSTQYGYWYANSLFGGTDQENTFALAAEAYRLMLRHQTGVDKTARFIGAMMCGNSGPIAAARCGQIGANATHDLLDPRNHQPTYLGSHIISGAYTYVDGILDVNASEQVRGLAEITYYGGQAVGEGAGWLWNQSFG